MGVPATVVVLWGCERPSASQPGCKVSLIVCLSSRNVETTAKEAFPIDFYVSNGMFIIALRLSVGPFITRSAF